MSSIATKTDGRTDHAETQAKPLIFFFASAEMTRTESKSGSSSGAGKRSRSSSSAGRGGVGTTSSDGGHQHKRSKHQHKRQPKRGGPGFLLTCEAGREGRCRGEGLDLLRHYFYHDAGGTGSADAGADVGARDDSAAVSPTETSTAAAAAERKELSLEEEIALLQSGASADDVLYTSTAAGGGRETKVGGGRKRAPFAVYDTGCKGTVIVLCTLPNCRLVDPCADADADADADGDTKHINTCKDDSSVPTDGNAGTAENNRTKLDGTTWDPVKVMDQITTDMIATSSSLKGETNLVASEAAREAPSTRHVTRLVPLQATCFAALDDIVKTARPLLEKYLISEVKKRRSGEERSQPTSFEIVFKHRFNSQVRRDPLIDALAKLIGELKRSHGIDDGALVVDLTNPDFSIQVEIVQNICGMSIVPGGRSYRKFNLVELMDVGRKGPVADGSSGAGGGNKKK